MIATYILCGTPRTGSTLLCSMLAASGVAGQPDSYVMPRFMADWAAEWGVPAFRPPGTAAQVRAYLQAALSAGRAGTRVFGLRQMQQDRADLMAMLHAAFPNARTDRARIEAAFGPTLYVHLSRRDKVAQAISLIRAEQTGLWHIAPDGTEVERLTPPAPAAYDFDRIHDTVTRLTQADADWSDWFAEQGISPLRLDYEAVSANPAAAVSQVLAAIGVSTPVPEGRPTVARMSNNLSHTWARQYRQTLAARP